MAISSPDRRVELLSEMYRIITRGGITAPIQMGILKDTWLAEFGEEVPELPPDILEFIKKATW